jgi:hypothetical protein
LSKLSQQKLPDLFGHEREIEPQKLEIKKQNDDENNMMNMPTKGHVTRGYM